MTVGKYIGKMEKNWVQVALGLWLLEGFPFFLDTSSALAIASNM